MVPETITRKTRKMVGHKISGCGLATRRREGSGSVSDTDFANFLNTARRSVFEVANMLILFTREKYLQSAELESLLPELAEQSRMILAFRRTLKDQPHS
jgi:four helix bundle protein